MGCLAGITGEPLKCLRGPVIDTFSHLFGHFFIAIQGFWFKVSLYWLVSTVSTPV